MNGPDSELASHFGSLLVTSCASSSPNTVQLGHLVDGHRSMEQQFGRPSPIVGSGGFFNICHSFIYPFQSSFLLIKCCTYSL